jgi:hypothetical protein
VLAVLVDEWMTLPECPADVLSGNTHGQRKPALDARDHCGVRRHDVDGRPRRRSVVACDRGCACAYKDEEQHSAVS